MAALKKRTIRMTEESKGGWNRLKRESGVNTTAIVEALGRFLAEGKDPIPPEVIELARDIQTERDSRS